MGKKSKNWLSIKIIIIINGLIKKGGSRRRSTCKDVEVQAMI